MNTKRLSAISYGHFSIDLLNSSIAIILTYLSGQFDLSVSQIGFGSMMYVFAASLTQPLFGLLADRVNGRWMGAVGLLWTIIFYAMIPFATDYRSLIVILVLAALGSAAFHPVGIVNASDAGGHRYPTTATSIFFGQSGLALGPVISGIVLQRYGLSALPFVALAMTPAVVMMAIYLHQPMTDHQAHEPGPAAVKRASRPAVPVNTVVIVAFVLAIALRATTIQAYVTLLPKYFSDLGYTAAAYGIMIGVFSFSGALGTFAGGYLGDRIERRMLMAVALVLSVPFSLALLNLHGAWGYFVAAACAGALLNIPHSILLIVGQELLPKRKGLMGGMVLGFMFASGAATTWIASWFADIIGLGVVLAAVAFLPLGAAAAVLILPKVQTIVIESGDAGGGDMERGDGVDPELATVATG